MTVDSMTRLAAANPVVDLPDVESPERLRRLIACPRTGENEAPSIGLDEFPRSSSRPDRLRIRRRALLAVPLCTAAGVAGVVLSSGSTGPGVNVAAAAYAATAPRSGIVEAVFFARVLRGSQAGGTLRQREWRDAQTGQRRMQNSTTGPYGDTRETHTLEMVFAPKRWETWSAGGEANTITRVTGRLDMKIAMQFDGIALDGLEAINLYRQLYRLGGMKLVGRERHGGRLLWKLESRPIGHSRADGRMLAISATHMRLIVLVDPKTFLPVSERQVDVALAGHPTIVESNLISYRHVIGGEAAGKLFDLAAQHPSARVRTSTVQSRFVSMRRHRPGT
jgi:hypothetical protein